jgi:hypothetical protein
MSHEAHITGYQNIVIQRVTDGRSMLHVNGEAEEICALVVLRVLLEAPYKSCLHQQDRINLS